MRITDVKPLVLGTSWRNIIFIKVETDEALTGIGEATIQNREEGVLGYLEGAKRRHVIGSDPFNVEDLWLRMYRNDFWRNGVIATTVMSAVEIACWDIIGKATGQPVYRLLGGQAHEKLKAYANGWYTVEREPQQFAARAKTVTAKGYKALKVDPFGPGTYEMSRQEIMKSLELVAAIRDAVGPDVEIFIEGHGRFSPRTAIQIGKQLEEFNPGWYEEPV
ncbi:MAG TPA: mandelate racemase/muconate lactonizing enzyme family protein, partial [Candidatus Latescibacteria bacterium]|nr:mandelate racemase/muconate lactonizing enzyme family protein [Candidatus Latescibacterota bacterium]